MIENMVFPIFIFLIVPIPPVSLLFSFFFVLFIKYNSKLWRSEYQNKLAICLALAILTMLVGRLGWLTFGVPPYIEAISGEVQQNPSAQIIYQLTAQFIPTVLYATGVSLAAKRIKGMGYNRFLSLFGCLPVIGPVLLSWLAFTIREREVNADEN